VGGLDHEVDIRGAVTERPRSGRFAGAHEADQDDLALRPAAVRVDY